MKNIDDEVEYLYDRLFTKYYSGNELNNWQAISFFGGGTAYKYKAKIKELLMKGKRVKTGYRTSKMIRGYATRYIFYK